MYGSGHRLVYIDIVIILSRLYEVYTRAGPRGVAEGFEIFKLIV